MNAAGTDWHEKDVLSLQEPGLSAAMLPKSENAEALAQCAAALPKGCDLIALVESALGIFNAQALAAGPGGAQLAFGSVDFQLDAGIPDSVDEFNAMLRARSCLVLASAAAGIAGPIDGVMIDLDGEDVLMRDVTRARHLGFVGKLCIHPRQIALVHKGFTASEEEIAKAQAIVTAADAVGAKGAIRLNGKLVDRPFVGRARLLLNTLAH